MIGIDNKHDVAGRLFIFLNVKNWIKIHFVVGMLIHSNF